MEQLLIAGVTMLGKGAFEYLEADDFAAAKRLWAGIEEITRKHGEDVHRHLALAGLIEGMARDRASSATSAMMQRKG